VGELTERKPLCGSRGTLQIPRLRGGTAFHFTLLIQVTSYQPWLPKTLLLTNC
jgi:hypothetical protein